MFGGQFDLDGQGHKLFEIMQEVWRENSLWFKSDCIHKE